MKKGTWVVIALVLALGAIYFYTKEDRVSVGVKSINLPAFSLDKVDKISLLGKEKTNLVKTGDHWMLAMGDEQPRMVKADATSVTKLLEAMLALRSSHYVTNLKEKYLELGLGEEEALEVKIFAGETVLWNVIFGKPESNGRYGKVPESNDVYLLKGSFDKLARNDPTLWRDRQIVPFAGEAITAIKIDKAGAQALSFVKENNEWQLAQGLELLPKGFRANKSAIAALVNTVAHLRASGFVDDATSLPASVLTARVSAADVNHVLHFYKLGDDKYLLKREGDEQLYQIAKYSFDKLNPALDELRDFSLMSFDKNQLSQVKLRHKDGEIALSKKDNAWQIDAPKKLPKDFEFDPSSVEGKLTWLSTLQAKRVADVKKDLPENPSWQKAWLLELITDKDEKIHFYAAKNKGNQEEYLVKGNIDDEIYILKSPKLGSLESGLMAFKKEKFELPPIDENTKGFNSLPVDVQRKLLNSTKKKN